MIESPPGRWRSAILGNGRDMSLAPTGGLGPVERVVRSNEQIAGFSGGRRVQLGDAD
jgi:hypothetical protein